LPREITVAKLKRILVLVAFRMRSASTSKWLRPAIGLIAAYAIALQTILAGLAPLGAAVLADESAVICHGAKVDDTQGDQGQAPSKHPGHVEHCALCAISPLVVPASAHVPRPARQPIVLAASRPTEIVLPRDIHARPGKPRDPPMSA